MAESSGSGVKRVRYFTGRLLTAEDLRDEQEYFRQRRFLHNRALHGAGVVSGLNVGLSTDTPPQIVVSPGLALDRAGREVVLETEVRVALNEAASPLYVLIEYEERETDAAPASATTASEATRIEEGAVVRLSSDPASGRGVAIGCLVAGATGWAVDAAFPRAARGVRDHPRQVLADDVRPDTAGRRPEVIVDFDVRDGLLFVSLKNIGDGSAYEVTTTFDPPFSGLDGKKDIAGMNVFRRVEFMPPGKAFVQLVDPLAVYASRQQPMKLSATISYLDRAACRYTDVIAHDLRIYLDLGVLAGHPPF